ncbi:hypothetical protein PIB30_105718 [Stylosanthes scabra]|uniref:Organ-specific protein S2 n=1 Tax=Stylosanthes scabra TaxID=79078 RepID=A0ABU6UXT7_9FABA|nr:hypothetical protein [Stylosanthes scabra]
MMKPTPLVLLSLLLFLFLVVASVESRKDPGMVEGFQSILQLKSENKPKTHQECEEEKVITVEKEVILQDFETRPSVTSYNDELVGHHHQHHHHHHHEGDKLTLMKTKFEPRPSVTAYNNDNAHSKLLKNNEFEPRPSVTAYNNDNVDSMLKNSEFEPRPSVTAYNKEFEPIPSVTKYND